MEKKFRKYPIHYFLNRGYVFQIECLIIDKCGLCSQKVECIEIRFKIKHQNILEVKEYSSSFIILSIKEFHTYLYTHLII